MRINPHEKPTKVIAVDFDGCLCENRYPECGEPNKKVIARLKKEIANGANIIIWTCRTGILLSHVHGWCCKHNVPYMFINENDPYLIAKYGSDCRKISADEYWDDKAVKIKFKSRRSKKNVLKN